MIEFHYLIYILFLTATSSKQISVGVILPFYDGLGDTTEINFYYTTRTRPKQKISP